MGNIPIRGRDGGRRVWAPPAPRFSLLKDKDEWDWHAHSTRIDHDTLRYDTTRHDTRRETRLSR